MKNSIDEATAEILLRPIDQRHIKFLPNGNAYTDFTPVVERLNEAFGIGGRNGCVQACRHAFWCCFSYLEGRRGAW